jgi:hypothetical protein
MAAGDHLSSFRAFHPRLFVYLVSNTRSGDDSLKQHGHRIILQNSQPCHGSRENRGLRTTGRVQTTLFHEPVGSILSPSELNDQIENWVNEGGAGGDVSR